MVHENTIALLAEYDDATAGAVTQFRIAQHSYLSALSTLTEYLGSFQQKTDEAEESETDISYLQRIEGIERQAHAVQMHAAKARIAVRNMKGAVDQLEIVTKELRGQVQKTSQPKDRP